MSCLKSYSDKTYFGNVKIERKPACQYDMLYDKSPYNPKAKRGDRTEQKIAMRNIWEQEKHKAVPSTSHLIYGRPTRKQYDLALKVFCRLTDEKEYRSKRLKDALEWVTSLEYSKFAQL